MPDVPLCPGVRGTCTSSLSFKDSNADSVSPKAPSEVVTSRPLQTWVQVPAPPPLGYVALGRCHCISEPHFPHLLREAAHSPCLLELV